MAEPTKADSGKEVTGERIMQMAFGYAPPLIVGAAVRHEVFDVLEKGPGTVEQICATTRTHIRGMRALLNALVGLELLSKHEDGRYALTPESSKFLVSSRPGFLGGLLKHTSTQLIPKWLQLAEVVRSGEPARAVDVEEEGAAFFHEFVEDLFPMNYHAAQVLADHLGVAQTTQTLQVLDLAAGSGVWSVALAEKSPHVRVTAVDWADVLTVTQRVTSQHGLADRYTFVPGDLEKADFGSGYQVAALGHILHSEGAERSKALLRKTYAALAPGGTIAIAEWLVNQERTAPAPGLIFAVNMLVNTRAGDTFSFEEIRDWLEAAGFGKVRKLEIPGPSPLILANRPA